MTLARARGNLAGPGRRSRNALRSFERDRGTGRAIRAAVRHTPDMGRAQQTRKGSYTWEDFVALPDDDRRELIDGELVEVEVPKRRHERIVGRLVYYLTAWTMRHGGEVLPSGYRVRVSERRGVMPDVQLFRAGNEPDESQDEGLVDGRPDVAIEIVSPSSLRYDRIVKLGYYLQLRVPEYWLVDPAEQTFERLVHSRKGYVIREMLAGNATFAPKEFRGLKIPLRELWTVPKKTK
jgi:Uma2 family endonuclease